MVTIYHNPKCSKSRIGLNYLQEKGIEPKIVEYLKENLSKKELQEIVSKLDCSIEVIIRKNETDYKENYKGKTLTEDEWIDALIKFPKLLERPIIINGNKAVVARPCENIDKII